MEHAIENSNLIKRKIKNASVIFLFLDYDGTLTGIKSRPEDAIPKKDMIEFLNNFSKKRFVINIISGRSLESLKKLIKKINLERINLIGSHGLEIQFADKYQELKSKQKFQLKGNRAIKKIKDIIIFEAKKIDNILIEEKPISFAIHYRNINDKDLPRVHALIKRLDILKEKYDFKYLEMKKVIEVMPANTGKGTAIHRIIKAYKNLSPGDNIFSICIGDDITDEDMFLANISGINIKVTNFPENTNTGAAYYLKDPGEVLNFLKDITN